jgi:hypothetical protein
LSVIADDTSDWGQVSIVLLYYDETTNMPVETLVTVQRLMFFDAMSILNDLSLFFVNFELIVQTLSQFVSMAQETCLVVKRVLR